MASKDHHLWTMLVIFVGSVTLVTSNDECARVADVVFVLDASESIYDDDFIRQMDFVINITREFYLNQTNGIIVGAVVYSSTLGNIIELSDFKTQPELENDIKSFVHLKDGTNTALGIRNMRTVFRNGGREDVSRIGVVVTDGRSLNRQETLHQAEKARKENITMIAVGVGIEIDFQELLGISSGTDFLFQVENYEALGGLALNLTTTLCPETPPLPPPAEVCQGEADVFYVIDGSESIFDEDFVTELEFVVGVTRTLYLNATGGFIVGVLVFSSYVNSIVHLQPFQDHSEFQQNVDQLTRIKAGTATDIGLRRAREVFEAEGRAGVRRIVIVITDGRSKNTTATSIEAGLIHDHGIEVIALGMGTLIDTSELAAIASQPDYVFTLEGFDEMRNFTETIRAILCPLSDDIRSTEPPSTSTISSTVMESSTSDITNTLTTAFPVDITTPSIDPCSNCSIINGVGYNPHPRRCDMYTHCYPALGGGFRAVLRHCPPGLFWQQSALTCNRPSHVDCPNDLCKSVLHGGKRFLGSCRTYWVCNAGFSGHAECCERFHFFDENLGCVEDRSCVANCPLDYEIPRVTPCHLEEHDTDPSKYYIYEWGARREMTCSAGTAFSFTTCGCGMITGSAQACRPDLYLPFDDFVDHAQGSWVDNRGATILSVTGAVGGQAAYFDGHARVLVPRFSSHDFRSNVFIKLRYLKDAGSGGRPQALLTNGDCSITPSIAIYHDMESENTGAFVRMASADYGAETSPVGIDWKEVTYSYDGNSLVLTTDDKSNGTAAGGDIEVVHAALHVGDGAGFANFRGYIDEVYIYLSCRP